MTPRGDSLVDRLRATFGSERILTGDWMRPGPRPAMTVLLDETTEVAIAMSMARESKTAVVVGGQGTRSAEQSYPRGDGEYLFLSTQRLSGVEKVAAESLWLEARAGTPLEQVAARAAEVDCRLQGLAEGARGTVGGWLACQARLADAVLGIPQPAVLALEAILADGTVVRSVPTPRSAVGPDLFSLFLGTRGAFGILTAATLKLEPIPERRLLSGLRFKAPEQAFAFARYCLGLPLPPAGAQVMIDGRAHKRMARVWMSFEGHAALARLASQMARRQGLALGGQVRPLERVRSWRDAASFDKRRCLEAPVRWSRLEDLLRQADRELARFPFAVLDGLCLTGGRLRLVLPKGHKGNPRRRWERMIDPDGEQGLAAGAAEAILTRLRRELDPDGLLNPQAWPLSRPGGVR